MSLRKVGSFYTEGLGLGLQWTRPARESIFCGRALRTSLGQVSPKRGKVKERQLQHHSLTDGAEGNPCHLPTVVKMNVVAKAGSPPLLKTGTRGLER